LIQQGCPGEYATRGEPHERESTDPIQHVEGAALDGEDLCEECPYRGQRQ